MLEISLECILNLLVQREFFVELMKIAFGNIESVKYHNVYVRNAVNMFVYQYACTFLIQELISFKKKGRFCYLDLFRIKISLIGKDLIQLNNGICPIKQILTHTPKYRSNKSIILE